MRGYRIDITGIIYYVRTATQNTHHITKRRLYE